MRTADVIVLGTGGVGSAALWHLARRGVHAVGLDRFEAGHDRGSSHGDTRIIRLAYFEHPDYVPLLRRSYVLWEELERETGRDLYTETGLLEVGSPDGVILPGVRRSAIEHDLEIEDLDAEQVAKRYPGFAVPEGMQALVEKRAGFLRVEACVIAHAERARAAGAALEAGVTVHGWRPDGDGVRVETDAGSWSAGGLVITAGAWAADLLRDLGLPLRVLRKPLFWFPAAPEYRLDAGAPVFFYEVSDGAFYGFPAVDEGLKVAEHTGGDRVDDPLALDRSLHAKDQGRVETFLTRHLPGVACGRPSKHAVCMYTSTPDGHFVVSRHPEHPRVSFAAGLSGHGFKLAPALGEVMADLAMGREPTSPVGFLGLERSALT